ncbi:hypothetical protein V1279_001361 [Bradyrhizobium sp. AZCC 1610]|uniref:hypothetical protein n=1 Tax=Bradyrhizobium sp. AZCC 1610 TaxID=3117020 RepID=UPI002FEFE393
MNGAVPRTTGSGDVGSGDNSDLAGIPEGMRHDLEFDGIDWSKAAPGWVSMFTGLFLPLLALALLVVSIDLALGWSFERWAGPSGMSPLLLAAVMLPPALISAFGCCKLFLYLKDATRTAARSGKRERVV